MNYEPEGARRTIFTFLRSTVVKRSRSAFSFQTIIVTGLVLSVLNVLSVCSDTEELQQTFHQSVREDVECCFVVWTSSGLFSGTLLKEYAESDHAAEHLPPHHLLGVAVRIVISKGRPRSDFWVDREIRIFAIKYNSVVYDDEMRLDMEVYWQNSSLVCLWFEY